MASSSYIMKRGSVYYARFLVPKCQHNAVGKKEIWRSLPKVTDAFSHFIADLTCPIVLDLNGDGVKYQSLASSKAFFDIDGDKFAEHVEWLDKNDGFLVRDLNANGKIDAVKEMFGEDGGTTAYAKLAALDSNKDSKITSADTAWSTLRIWQDANRPSAAA